MSPDEFETRFVQGLGGVERARIWRMFQERVLNELIRLDVKCEIWLDGSFITKRPEPDDIDGSIMVEASQVDQLSEDAVNYLNLFDDSESPFDPVLDIFLCVVYPPGHELRDDMNDPDGWAKQWSIERNSNWLKGFAVISLR